MDGVDASGSRTGEDSDKHVLLHVERPWVQRELPLRPLHEHAPCNRRRHQVSRRHHRYLRRYRRHRQWLPPESEELVQEGEKRASYGSQNPCPESEGRQRRIVAHRNRQRYLLDRRILGGRRVLRHGDGVAVVMTPFN